MSGSHPSSGPGSVAEPDLTLEDRGTARRQRALSTSVSRRWPLTRKLAFGSLFAAFVLCCTLLVVAGTRRGGRSR